MTEYTPIVPTLDQLTAWETEFFDEEQNLDVLLCKAYEAGYWRCQGEYDAAASQLVNPLDVGIIVELDDDD